MDSDDARGRKRAAEAMVEALQPAESTPHGAAEAPATPTRASSSSEAVVRPSDVRAAGGWLQFLEGSPQSRRRLAGA
eukprot:13297444-Alexandrium_andersonii.AAC.1